MTLHSRTTLRVLQIIVGVVILTGILTIILPGSGMSRMSGLLPVALGVYLLYQLKAPKEDSSQATVASSEPPATISQTTDSGPSGEEVCQYIEQISVQGFVLEHEGNRLMMEWAKVREVYLEDANSTLVIIPLEGESQRIADSAGNFYQLLQQVPPHFARYKKDYVQQLLQQVVACKVCGTIAVKDTHCLSCGSSVWPHGAAADFAGEQDYVISEQLELFATYEPEGKVEFYWQGEDGFKQDPLWRPLVSEQQVIVYSRQYCWNPVTH